MVDEDGVQPTWPAAEMQRRDKIWPWWKLLSLLLIIFTSLFYCILVTTSVYSHGDKSVIDKIASKL